MRVFGRRNVSIVVRDIEKSLKFYSRILELKVLHREIKEGLVFDRIVGIPGVKIDSAKLELPDGSILELLQYVSHPDPSWYKNYPPNRHGYSHITLSVDNVEEFYDLFCKKDIHCISEPQLISDDKLKVMYCHDPDGIIIEFIEELDFVDL